MDITKLLNESLEPETATLVESAITEVIKEGIKEGLKDSATQQAQQAQKSQEEIENISTSYDVEMKKAVKKVVELERFYKQQSKIAVDKVLKAYDDAEKLEEHYIGQLQEAVDQYITETSQESVSKLQESVAQYVAEKAELIEHAQGYAEKVRQDTLNEMQGMVQEATQEFIKENQVKFDGLDKMARYETTLNTIKESFEKIGLGLSENEAFTSLEESVQAKETEISQLKESLASKEKELFETAKTAKFAELTESFSDLQRENLQLLSESITASDIDQYAKTMSYIIKNASFKSDEKPLTESTKEDTNTQVEKSLNEAVKHVNQRDLIAQDFMSKMI